MELRLIKEYNLKAPEQLDVVKDPPKPLTKWQLGKRLKQLRIYEKAFNERIKKNLGKFGRMGVTKEGLESLKNAKFTSKTNFLVACVEKLCEIREKIEKVKEQRKNTPGLLARIFGK